MPEPRTAIVLASLAALAALAAGCGGDDDDERQFTGVELVSELNAQGTRLVLGAPLVSDREDTEIYALGISDPSRPGASTGGGSLTVTADSEAGFDEYKRCESASTLLCFRANNVVLAFEGELAPRELATLVLALRKLAGVPAAQGSGG